MPNLAAEEKHIAGPTKNRFHSGPFPGDIAFLVLNRMAARLVATGNHVGRGERFIEIIQVEMGGAKVDRIPFSVAGNFFVGRHQVVVNMRRPAIVARMALPGGLADDVALLAHRRLSKVHDSRAIDEIEEERVSIKDALVVLGQVHVVETERTQPINRGPRFLHFFQAEHAGNQGKTVFVQSIGHALKIVNGKGLL
jgi:hypothetical protein